MHYYTVNRRDVFVHATIQEILSHGIIQSKLSPTVPLQVNIYSTTVGKKEANVRSVLNSSSERKGAFFSGTSRNVLENRIVMR